MYTFWIRLKQKKIHNYSKIQPLEALAALLVLLINLHIKKKKANNKSGLKNQLQSSVDSCRHNFFCIKKIVVSVE